MRCRTRYHVGRREQELHDIHGKLVLRRCRLLTVHGAGGVGKSRLAIEAARRLEGGWTAGDGAHFVQLEEARTPAAVVAAVAETLGVSLGAHAPADLQVLDAIGDKELLLVLDNYEHLVGTDDLPIRLIRGCPNVQLLVTSRQRLNHPEEHLLTIDGLPFDDVGGGEAMRLLRDRIEQHGHPAPLDPSQESHAHRICQLLHGLPLGIELAASWTRILDLAGVVTELAENPADLAHRDGQVSTRHRSLRSAFEVSWRLLDAGEKDALARLSVFRGGFERDAAAAVAGVDLDMLARLTDKALIRTTDAGRHERHPLVHQFSGEKLAENPRREREARDAHARFFFDAIRRFGSDGMGSDRTQAAWDWFTLEFANLGAAWDHALTDLAAYRDDVIASGWYLSHYADRTSRYGPVRDLERRVPRGLEPQVEGEVLAFTTWLSMRLGEPEAAIEDSAASLRILAPFDESTVWRGLWSAHEGAFAGSLMSGDYEAAPRHIAGAIACARNEIARRTADGRPSKEPEIALGLSFTALGWSHVYSGKFAEAMPLIQEARHLLEKNRSSGLPYALHLQGQAELYAGDVAGALVTLRHALAQTRLSGFEAQEGQVLDDLAQAHLALGDLDAAVACCRSGLSITRHSGNRWHQTMLHTTHARILLASGRTERALRALAESARTALASEATTYTAPALITLAEHRARAGDTDLATELLAAVLAEAGVPSFARAMAERVAETHRIRLGVDAASPGSMKRWLERMVSTGSAAIDLER